MTTTLDTDAPDTDAPYGRKPDGTPYKIPPDHPFRSPDHKARSTGSAGGRKGARPPKSPRPRKPGSGGNSSSSSRSRAPDYTEAVTEAVQLAAIGVALLSPISPAFKADAVALGQRAEGIASAVNHLARDNPALAAFLDRLADVGPYAELAGELLPLFVQGAANHKLMPKGIAITLGATDPDDLIGAVDEEARRLTEDDDTAEHPNAYMRGPAPTPPIPASWAGVADDEWAEAHRSDGGAQPFATVPPPVGASGPVADGLEPF